MLCAVSERPPWGQECAAAHLKQEILAQRETKLRFQRLGFHEDPASDGAV